jgi:hypothetical protein
MTFGDGELVEDFAL